MKKRTAFLLVFAGILLGAATVPSTTSRPATAPATTSSTKPATTSAPALAKSARDGIYNDEQLARGKKAYFTNCARCHGDTLLGNDDAPALITEFIDKWSSKSVGELVEYTRKEMPSDGPGKMSRKDCTDITMFLLNSNGFPTGKNELPPDPDVMNAIPIQVKK